MKYALITGINGQDGSYLSELLLKKGYTVFGIIRKKCSFNTQNIDHIFHLLNIRYGDVCDTTSIYSVLLELKDQPNIEVIEVYNLAAQSHVGASFQIPEYSAETNYIGCLRILEAICKLKMVNFVKFYQASTSELFGEVASGTVLSENTPFNPVSPYSIAKQGAFYSTKLYRDAFKLFACNGILFNHESPRRGDTFVTKKIVNGVKKLKTDEDFILELGNIYSVRDWGHAKEYVNAMWLMLQHDKPDDYIVSTNSSITVKEFVNKCLDFYDVKYNWSGDNDNEKCYDSNSGRILIQINPKFYRPHEVPYLNGDFSKIKNMLKWEPTIDIDKLISDMFLNDISNDNLSISFTH